MTLKSPHTLLDVLHTADSHTPLVVPEFGTRGDRVAMALPNGLPAIVSFLAASISGTTAPLNPAYPLSD